MDNTVNILAIDDNLTNQKLIDRCLRGKYNVIQAMSGQEGIDRAQEYSPALILLDVDMPGMNGYQTCREIRMMERFTNTPILFLSCFTAIEAQLESYAAGADDYISKPFNIDVLTAKINRALKRGAYVERQFHQGFDSNFATENLSNMLLRSMKAEHHKEILDALYDAAQNLKLTFALCVKLSETSNEIRANFTPLSSLEEVLLDQYENDYLLGSGTRLILSTKHLSLLIRNMPGQVLPYRKSMINVLEQMLEASELRLKQLEEKKLNTYLSIS